MGPYWENPNERVSSIPSFNNKVQICSMTLGGEKFIMIALCFLNNQGNQNLCLALMSWVQRTSQLGFQDFLMWRNHL